MVLSVGDRIVVIAEGPYFQKHGEVVGKWWTMAQVDVNLDGRVLPFRDDEVVTEAEWFRRAADEMED